MKRRRCPARHPELGVRCELKHRPETDDHKVFRRRKPEDVITWPNEPPAGLKVYLSEMVTSFRSSLQIYNAAKRGEIHPIEAMKRIFEEKH